MYGDVQKTANGKTEKSGDPGERNRVTAEKCGNIAHRAALCPKDSEEQNRSEIKRWLQA